MRKFTLIIAFIAMVSFVFGQRANTPTFFKGEANINRNMYQIHPNNNRAHSAAKPATLIWSDDFTTSSNWSLTHSSTTTQNWVVSTARSAYMAAVLGALPATFSGNLAYVDGISAIHNAGGTGTVPLIDAWCETANSINLTGYTSVSLKFDQQYVPFNSDTSFVIFSTDGGITWPISINPNPRSATPVNTFAPDSFDAVVSQYIANQSNVKIRFRFLTTSNNPLYGSGYGWTIDNIELVQPNANNLAILGILPSFDNPYAGSGYYYFVEGTYKYFPGSSPTRILNAAYITNSGSANQTNTLLTVTINDPYSSTYTETSATGHTINSGTTNDTLTVGYTLSAGTATYTNPFYLNCASFTSTTALQNIVNQKYTINYALTSSAIPTPTSAMVDSFSFYVGYQGNPYTNTGTGYVGPDLQYSFARNNQNPHCGGVSPQDWSIGHNNGDGIYTSFAIQDQGGLNATPTCVNYMNIFISDNRTTFDATTHIGATITGYIYYYDATNSSWSQQLYTGPYDITPADTGHFKQLDFLWNTSNELLSAGAYIVGVEVTNYNNDSIEFGEDYSTLQSWASTYWYFAGTTYPREPMGNYSRTPMINLNVFSDPLTIKHINDDNIVKVYPNPSNGLVDIVAPENSRIEIYNLLGIKVSDVEHSTATLNHFDLTAYKDGNYIVKVTSGKKVTTRKLSIVR